MIGPAAFMSKKNIILIIFILISVIRFVISF